MQYVARKIEGWMGVDVELAVRQGVVDQEKTTASLQSRLSPWQSRLPPWQWGLWVLKSADAGRVGLIIAEWVLGGFSEGLAPAGAVDLLQNRDLLEFDRQLSARFADFEEFVLLRLLLLSAVLRNEP
ncbi:MAG TPA: hypothetical protein VH302_06320, partial [Bryobacteraceae bacterium]|nr:hypothetical protein [Bryobacteraceae bacterium]